jgi:hypothetical protein
MTVEETIEALIYQDSQRKNIPIYEIRRQREQPLAPSWETVSSTHMRQYACLIGELLWRHQGWNVEVWVIRNQADPDTGEERLVPEFVSRYGE